MILAGKYSQRLFLFQQQKSISEHRLHLGPVGLFLIARGELQKSFPQPGGEKVARYLRKKIVSATLSAHHLKELTCWDKIFLWVRKLCMRIMRLTPSFTLSNHWALLLLSLITTCYVPPCSHLCQQDWLRIL